MRKNMFSRSIRATRAAATGVQMNVLEQRLHLSVTAVVYDGTLSVNGDGANNRFVVDVTGDSVAKSATVALTNGSGPTAGHKTFLDITSVVINGNAGDDFIKLRGHGLSDFWFSTSISEGDGNGTVIIDRYDGVVSVNGDEGKDYISASNAIGVNEILGQNSYRWLYGNAGNDTIIGSNAGDGLYGGDGRDTLYGGAGDDNLNGGRGRNLIDCGSGDDMVYVNALTGTSLYDQGEYSVGGYDTIFGGAGHDRVYHCFNSDLGVTPVFGDTNRGINEVIDNDYASNYGEKG